MCDVLVYKRLAPERNVAAYQSQRAKYMYHCSAHIKYMKGT